MLDNASHFISFFSTRSINSTVNEHSCTLISSLNMFSENETLGTFFFGQGGNVVRGRSYHFPQEDIFSADSLATITVTDDTCVPLTFDVYGKLGESK